MLLIDLYPISIYLTYFLLSQSESKFKFIKTLKLSKHLKGTANPRRLFLQVFSFCSVLALIPAHLKKNIFSICTQRY